jgi:hypothetical protein
LIEKKLIESNDFSQNTRIEQELIDELNLSKELPTNNFDILDELATLNDFGSNNHKREKRHQFEKSTYIQDAYDVIIPKQCALLSNPYLEIKSKTIISNAKFIHDLLGIFRNNNSNMIRVYALQENVQIVISRIYGNFSNDIDELWLIVDEYYEYHDSHNESKKININKNAINEIARNKVILNKKRIKKILPKSNTKTSDIIQDVSIDCSSEYLFGWELNTSLKFPLHTKLVTFRFVPK